jgi:hypothetical protein
MQERKPLGCLDSRGKEKSRSAIFLRRSCACMAMMAALAGTAQNSLPPGGALRTDKAYEPTPLNQAPDANAQMELRNQQASQQSFAAANSERRKQIADDSARLLKLATDLKAEVDKTTKDTLSLNVIRKADEIEKLAHGVKEKMKLTMGGN